MRARDDIFIADGAVEVYGLQAACYTVSRV